MWIVDTFLRLTPGAVHEVHELPRDFVAENIRAMNSLVAPWHQWLDPAAYGRHVADLEAFGMAAVASAHGPILTGDAIHDAFNIVRDLAGELIVPAPGQELLGALVRCSAAA